jgi:hypothetical protein
MLKAKAKKFRESSIGFGDFQPVLRALAFDCHSMPLPIRAWSAKKKNG